MTVKVSLTTCADRHYSGDTYTVPQEDLEKGVNVVRLFPNSYWEYVEPIYVKALPEEGCVAVDSRYGSCRYPMDKQSRWESGEIGLSYACCEIGITFIP